MFDYILPIYFVILYNTTVMSHLKVVLTFIISCWYKKVFLGVASKYNKMRAK
jgi:hypothetical protein